MDDGRKWRGSDVLRKISVAEEMLPRGEANTLQAWTVPYFSVA
jgi:hypothetical protein